MINLIRKLTGQQSQELGKELKQFDVTEEAIARMAEEFLPLKIDGLEDREGLAKVHAARMTVRDRRCRVEDRRKELVADALKHQRNVNAVAKHITAQLTAIEDDLQTKEDQVAQLKEARRAEKQRLEDERIERERQEAAERAHQEERARLEREAQELEARKAKAEEDRRTWEERIRKEQAELKAQREALEEEKRKLAPPAFFADPDGGVVPPAEEIPILPAPEEPIKSPLGFTGSIYQPAQDPDPEPQPIDHQADRIQDQQAQALGADQDPGPAPQPELFPAHESAQESDGTKLLHRCDLIVDNLTDMESLVRPAARQIWEEFTSDIRERVEKLRRDARHFLNQNP